MSGWRYYNHAILSCNEPHENADISKIENGTIWCEFKGKSVYLARWTSDYDMKSVSNWWYTVKDTPFDINNIKAKRRYEINKGIKCYSVEVISPSEYKEELLKVEIDAKSSWPKKYRPKTERNQFFDFIDTWNKYTVYGAFNRETNEMCSYAILEKHERCIDFHTLRSNPSDERNAVNAAVVYKILEDNADFLSNGGYVCDGDRNINHETHFQDYLEKYFGFRRAYCRLNIEYHPKIRKFIPILYSFRGILKVLDGISVVHKINSVIKMEAIVRGDCK